MQCYPSIDRNTLIVEISSIVEHTNMSGGIKMDTITIMQICLVDSPLAEDGDISEIIELNEQQRDNNQRKPDMDKLDENMRDKSELISRLNMLDDGFSRF